MFAYTKIMQALRGVSAVVTDAYFNLVTLLLPGNGTNGAQNNTFLDSSSNNFTITRNGNTTQGTFSPFSQTGWSNYFDGTGDYLSVGTITALGSGDFTISTWVYPQKISSGVFHVGGLPSSVTGVAVFLSGTAAEGWGLYAKNSQAVSNTGAITLNKWYYITVIRSGTTTTLYVDGVSAVVISSDSTNYTQTSLVIGGFFSTSFLISGYISNFRIVSSALTATTPTAPFTAVSGTTLLTCQSNRFVDNGTANSGSGYTITVNGDTSIQAFSPFAPTAAYSAATVGGSGYFDGTGDNLAVPTNSANSVGSGSFYFEAWVYLTNPSVAQMIIADPSNTGGLFVGLNIDGGGRFAIGRTAVAVDNFVNLTWVGNQWYHLAVNRNGTSLQFFVNGTQVGSTGSNSVNYPSVGYRVGAEQSAGSAALTGYISGLRLVKSSVNTGNFTPPTAPPDASTAALCLQFTNAGITDATAKNVLETVGNAQISTTQSKFGDSSMYFDGTGDYLTSPNLGGQFDFRTGDFTIELWVYASSGFSGLATVISKGPVGTVDTTSWTLQHNTSGSLSFYGPSSTLYFTTTSTPWTTGFSHIAICRSGSNTRLFVNGTQQGSTYTTLQDFSAGNPLIVGSGYYDPPNRSMNGYLDDVRITKGYARYTANFTAPSSAFALQ